MDRWRYSVVRRIRMTVLLLGIMLLAAVSASADVIDTSRTDCTLTIRYEAVGAVCEIYRAADIEMAQDGSLSYTLTEAFAGAKVLFDDQSASGWSAAASTLAAYADAHSIKPDAKVKISEQGTGTASGLRTGLYLVCSAACTYDDYVYTVTPCLVVVPGTEDEMAVNTSTWNYAVTMDIKPDKAKESENPEETQYKVIKVWSGDSKSSRPSSIKVKITCKSGSKTSAETVTLSADNDWSYSWKSKDTDAVYTVDEDPVPSGYTRTVVKRKGSDGVTTFVITNTIGEKETEPKKPKTPGGSVKTGDTTNLLLPVTLLALSAALILAVIWLLVRRKKGNR